MVTGHFTLETRGQDGIPDPVVVGGHDDLVRTNDGRGVFGHPNDERPALEISQGLAGKPLRAEAGRNDHQHCLGSGLRFSRHGRSSLKQEKPAPEGAGLISPVAFTGQPSSRRAGC